MIDLLGKIIDKANEMETEKVVMLSVVFIGFVILIREGHKKQ